ncbi:MAG: hypothetical protein LBJ61_03660 [Deltaproteobacteria bacterium]|jgi:hypothetical protein|nr:hypothetical protein [Deltaproteobacteria bacterium]
MIVASYVSRRKFVVWGEEFQTAVNTHWNRNAKAVVGPSRLADWPFGQEVHQPFGGTPPFLPGKEQSKLYQSLRDWLFEATDVYFVYPPGAEFEALTARMSEALRLPNPLVARVTRLTPDRLRTAIREASPPDLPMALFHEAREVLRSLPNNLAQTLKRYMGVKLPISGTMSPLLRRLAQDRRRVLAPGGPNPVTLTVQESPLKAGASPFARIGLTYGPIYGAKFTAKNGRVYDMGQALTHNLAGYPTTGPFFRESPETGTNCGPQRDKDFFKTFVHATSASLFLFRLNDSCHGGYDIYDLAQEAEERKGFTVKETLYWAEYLFRKGLVDWPFESLAPVPALVHIGFNDASRVGFKLESQAPRMSLAAGRPPKGLPAPATEIFCLCRELLEANSPANRDPDLPPPVPMIGFTRNVEGQVATLVFPRPGASAIGHCRESANKLVAHVKGLDYDGYKMESVDFVPTRLAREICQAGASTLAEYDRGVSDLLQAKCLSEENGFHALTKWGRIFNSTMAGRCFNDPDRLLAAETGLLEAAHSLPDLTEHKRRFEVRLRMETVIQNEIKNANEESESVSAKDSATYRLINRISKGAKKSPRAAAKTKPVSPSSPTASPRSGVPDRPADSIRSGEPTRPTETFRPGETARPAEFGPEPKAPFLPTGSGTMAFEPDGPSPR